MSLLLTVHYTALSLYTLVSDVSIRDFSLLNPINKLEAVQLGYVPNSDRGRPVSLTAQDLLEKLRLTQEPYTVSNFADAFDVSNETVRNRLEQLERYAGVTSKRAGRATVYWYSTTQAIEDRNFGGDDVLEYTADVDRQEVIQYEADTRARTRGLWLYRREGLAKHRSETHPTDANSIYYRAVMWEAVGEYLSDISSTWPRVFEDAWCEMNDDVSPEERLINLDEWGVDERTFEYYTKEIPLFGSGLIGDVEGLAEFRIERGKVNDALFEVLKEQESEPSPERLDELLPAFEDTLRAGDAFDDFVCEMHDWSWCR